MEVLDERPTGDLGELPRVFGHIRHLRKRQFLAGYALTGQLRKAARLSRVHERFHYFWSEKDPVYVEAFKKAQQIAADRAEDEVYRRGIEGYEKPLHHKGKLTGDTIREYSDNLAKLVLQGLRPEKYRDNVILQQSTVNALEIVLTHKDQTDSPERIEGILLERPTNVRANGDSTPNSADPKHGSNIEESAALPESKG